MYMNQRSWTFLITLLVLISLASSATHADILRWDTGEVIPGTEGVVPGSGVRLSDWNTDDHNLRFADFEGLILSASRFASSWLDNAHFIQADLARASFSSATLTDADFSQANLASADFDNAQLTDADLTDAVVTGADFEDTTLSEEQLYSTASYKMQDLQGINLEDNNMAGWNFAGQNLANADIQEATLTRADLSGANLANVNFRGVTLIEANLSRANLANADFTKRPNGTQYANLNRADFSGANLANANLASATLTDADLSFADLRGTTVVGAVGFASADMNNSITPDGLINGLELDNDERLVVRDHQVPVRIDDSMSLAESATLELLFVDVVWSSTIGVEPDVVPDLGGTLALSFNADANIGTLVGVTFQLFNWNGQLPTDEQFDHIHPAPGHVWDTSRLYTSGEVTLLSAEILLGDVNLDGQVNGLDVDPFVDVLLASRFDVAADMNGDGVVNGLDVEPFVATVGGSQPIPEPSTLLLALVTLGVIGGWRKWAT